MWPDFLADRNFVEMFFIFIESIDFLYFITCYIISALISFLAFIFYHSNQFFDLNALNVF